MTLSKRLGWSSLWAIPILFLIVSDSRWVQDLVVLTIWGLLFFHFRKNSIWILWIWLMVGLSPYIISASTIDQIAKGSPILFELASLSVIYNAMAQCAELEIWSIQDPWLGIMYLDSPAHYLFSPKTTSLPLALALSSAFVVAMCSVFRETKR